MTSFFSHLSPIPSFPAYTGPYKVGTQDFEIPVAELPSPTSAPDPSISTVSFRIFYPCEPEKHKKPVYWLPAPQSQYFRAYARFLNASHKLATFLSYLPILRTIFYTTIPAIRDAKIAPLSKGLERWPVMVFSHGLGGSRNAYSHITGSLASHGMVVVAPEHRDGSAPISFIHDPKISTPRAVDYLSLPYSATPEVERKRNGGLKIRLWELGLIHDALLKLDNGDKFSITAPDCHHDASDDQPFKDLLDIHDPGKISWAGHSFGASTVIQFLKSVYYPPPPHLNPQDLLYTPPSNSTLKHQITPSSPLILLDVWSAPLQFPSNAYLLAHPLPAYQSPDGSAPLAILSEAFYKWKSNFNDTKAAISPPPQHTNTATIKPNIFYPISSAHLSQSDFGPLFPFLTRKVFKAEDPERTMRLNVRAILESLRRSGIKVADSSAADMEIRMPEMDVSGAKQLEQKQMFPLSQDYLILAEEGGVKGWVRVPLDEGEGDGVVGANGHAIEARGEGEAVMEGEVMKG
ncbi:hypothetical protein ACLMJK_008301 [Lecanora helva]